MNKEKQYKELIELNYNASRLITNAGSKEVINYMEVVKHNVEKALKELGYKEEQIKKDTLELYNKRM